MDRQFPPAAGRSRVTILLLCAWLAALAACSDDARKDAPAAAEDASTGTDAAVSPDTEADAAVPEPDAASPSDDAAADVAPAKLQLVSLTPAQGKASGGETIVLEGTGFSAEAQVLFGGTPVDAAAVIVLDATTIQVQTPPGTPGLVDVSVVIPGDPAISTKLEDAFLYYNDVIVTKIEPAEGPVAGGTPVTIHGTGFAGKTSVLFGGKPAIDVQIIADDEVIAVTPPGAFGAQPVHVVNERGSGLMKKGFFYFAAPTITALAPAAGPTAGGTAVTLTGSGLTKDVEISIGAAKASVVEANSTGKIVLATPPGPAGKATVVAKTKYGTATLEGGYVYSDDKGQAATQLLSIAPAQGPLSGGNQVALVATGLVSASDTTVLFGNKLAKVVQVLPAAHTAVVQVPKGAVAGPVDVTLMTSKGTAKAAAGYTYSDALVVTSVAPNAGPAAGNSKIVIKGSGFAKGKPTVKIGALQAVAVAVVSDTELQAVTPPGSPGYVDVVVGVGGDVAVLAKGYAYTGASLELFVAFPGAGAQAGGTQVHLYGNGFASKTEVRFGGKPATHFTFLDSTHVTVKTPPGTVGAVDVSVQVDGAQAVLKNGFTYFNPMSQYGGTWGAEIDGSVNITVLDASNGQPVPDAFTMLWTDPTTPYQGFTNADGQITFSGDDVVGKQMVSVSKENYESASVVLFDASNVTLHITPIPPPSPGSPPPGPPAPSVAGKVVDLDKYVMIPVGSCNAKIGGVAAPTCSSCSSDAGCQVGGNKQFACVDIGGGNGKRCVADCSLGQGCPTSFKCQSQPGAEARCVPSAGELTAVCYHTKPSILSQDNYPPEGPGFEATPWNNFSYKIMTAYGEMAIVCFGGYKTFGAQLVAGEPESMQAFTPTIMGVKRHVMVNPDKPNVTGMDIKLTMPLTKKANVRLDLPPAWPLPPNNLIFTASWAMIVFGGDGVITMPEQAIKTLAPFPTAEPDHLEIDKLPAAMSGDLHDASLSILAIALQYDQLTQAQIPNSITIKNDIQELSNDSMVRRLGGGDFESVDTGVKKNIHGLWGTDSKNLYAVGAQGTLVHWNGGGWTLQANFTKDDLKAVHGADKSHVWAVGWNGAAGHFDGVSWQPTPMLSGNANLNGVFAIGDGQGGYDVWAASQQGIYKIASQGGQQGWQKYNPSPFANFLGIHGSDKDHVWAVGMTGQIAHWNGQQWKSQVSGTAIALRGVWAAGPTSAYAVGEKGQILHWDGKAWSSMQSPVQTTLVAVHGSSDQDVWAVGSKGVVLHYDGKAWGQVDVGEVDKSLNAVWAAANGDFYSLGEQELLLGPILYPPLENTPVKNGVLVGNTLKWTVDPATVEPHFNYVTIGIPGMGPDTPVWNIMTKGSISEVELPDFPSIQGTPGIPKGTTLRLTIIRGYKEGFDIDAYDNSDLNALAWRSWATNQFFFTRQ